MKVNIFSALWPFKFGVTVAILSTELDKRET